MKKVLIITYYWPPAGGPGVQRVLKFAKYLPEFGWRPHILTVREGEFPAIDNSLLDDIPEDIFIHKTKSFEPFAIYKKFIGKKEKDKIPTYILNQSKSDSLKDRIAKRIRLNFFIPDAKIGWIPFAVSDGLKILKKLQIDLIFSSSPPQTINLIAKKLSKQTGIPWVADYRDPWTDAFWQEGGSGRNFISQNIDKRFEKSALSSAKAISTVSKSLIHLFKNKVANDYFLIPNGFDADDFGAVKKVDSDKFRISYIGYLGKNQRIDNFLSALKTLDKEVLNKLDIQFYGNIHPVIVSKISELSLNDLISINNYIPHDEAIKTMKNSEMLLLVIPDVPNNELIVTGKLFEYLATENFILGIGPKHSNVVEILEETNCGKMFNYNEDLKKVLLSQIQNMEQGKMQKTNSDLINNFNRKTLTEKLAAKFNQVLARK